MIEIQIKVLHMRFNNNNKKARTLNEQNRLNSTREIALRVLKGTHHKKVIFLKQPQNPLFLSHIMQLGFKHPNQTLWLPTEIEQMKDFLMKLYKQTATVETKDPYYFISHHILQKSKSETEVKNYISKYFFRQ